MAEDPQFESTYTEIGDVASELQNQGEETNVQPAQFEPVEKSEKKGAVSEIDLISDIPLELTVELGRTTRKIRDILSLVPGSVIELNKLAGEPVDVLANGKLIAKGEVVVIDENFGVRITDIITKAERSKDSK